MGCKGMFASTHRTDTFRRCSAVFDTVGRCFGFWTGLLDRCRIILSTSVPFEGASATVMYFPTAGQPIEAPTMGCGQNQGHPIRTPSDFCLRIRMHTNVPAPAMCSTPSGTVGTSRSSASIARISISEILKKWKSSPARGATERIVEDAIFCRLSIGKSQLQSVPCPVTHGRQGRKCIQTLLGQQKNYTTLSFAVIISVRDID